MATNETNGGTADFEVCPAGTLARLRELIEADNAFDVAHRAWGNATAGGVEDLSEEEWRQVADGYEAATMRRIAALNKAVRS